MFFGNKNLFQLLSSENFYYLSWLQTLCQILLFVLASIFSIYCWLHRDRPIVYTSTTKESIQDIIRSCPILHQTFRVPIFGLNNHIQTIYSSMLRKGPPNKWDREILVSPDGGVFALDWKADNVDKDAPLILVVPGVTNSSDSGYISIFSDLCGRSGLRPIVIVQRGCGGLCVHTPKLFTYGGTVDLRQAVLHIAEKCPHTPLFAVGFSMGANVLAKYLGEYGNDSKITSAACVAQGFDGLNGVRALNKVYNYILTTKMQNMIKRHQDRFEKSIDIARILAAKHLEEFDEQLAILYGYENVESYYTKESCIHHISNIQIPLVFLNAKDDPLIPESLMPFDLIEKNKNLFIVMTTTGGHLGWQEGFLFPNHYSWSDRFLIEYFSYFINKKKRIQYQK